MAFLSLGGLGFVSQPPTLIRLFAELFGPYRCKPSAAHPLALLDRRKSEERHTENSPTTVPAGLVHDACKPLARA